MGFSAKDINEQVAAGRLLEIVTVAEARHAEQLETLVDIINQANEGAENFTGAIFVTGPSASGKTVFSNRLAKKLEDEGYFSSVISIDDYYRDRDDIHRMQIEQGIVAPDATQFDYERLDAFDVEFFRNQMREFLSGKEIVLPKYDFLSGMRTDGGRTLKRKGNTVIIVEGIQAMNPALWGGLPFTSEFNVYICPFTEFETDGKVISSKQLRFLRRSVRDIISRGTSVGRNLEMWSAVRQGEEKYIKPMKQFADYFFDSTLEYEMCFYRSRLEELIESLDSDTLKKLGETVDIDAIRCFPPIREIKVPEDSIFKEFYVG